MVAEAIPFRRSRTERKVMHIEEVRAWKAARYLGQKAVFGGQFDPMVASTAGAEIVALADRRLRQINGGPDVA
jgi:hypothetical protein